MVCVAPGTPNELFGLGLTCYNDPIDIFIVLLNRLFSSDFQIWPSGRRWKNRSGGQNFEVGDIAVGGSLGARGWVWDGSRVGLGCFEVTPGRFCCFEDSNLSKIGDGR